MNDNIKYYLSQADISPVEYTWMDLSGYHVSKEDWGEVLKVTGSLNEMPIKDHPLPFERTAAVVRAPLFFKSNKDALTLVTIVRESGAIFYTLHMYVGDSKYPAVVGKMSDDSPDLPDLPRNKKAMQFTLEKKFERQLREIGFNGENITDVCKLHYTEITHQLYTLTVKPDPLISVGRPVGDISKNAKRKRKGKAQFWEWKTIELKSTVALPSAPLGGTHASPKPHERMGHWRQYKSGKRVFIKAHIVNKHKIETDGFVFHDYVKH
jgi:hypothetical protein